MIAGISCYADLYLDLSHDEANDILKDLVEGALVRISYSQGRIGIC